MGEMRLTRNSTMRKKIEKMEKGLIEGDREGFNKSDNQWKREEKLKRKLRYLEFYEAYPVKKCPESWHCSNCREVTIKESVKIHPDCKMRGEYKHRNANKKDVIKINTKWVCDDKDEHQKEWEAAEKSSTEVNSEIKRQFSMLISKEKVLESNKKEKKKQRESYIATKIDYLLK